MLTDRIGDSCQLVGDDLFVTNHVKLKQAIDKKIGKCHFSKTQSNRKFE